MRKLIWVFAGRIGHFVGFVVLGILLFLSTNYLQETILKYQLKLFKSGSKYEPPRDKINNVAVCPAKTQISLGICPVWS